MKEAVNEMMAEMRAELSDSGELGTESISVSESIERQALTNMVDRISSSSLLVNDDLLIS